MRHSLRRRNHVGALLTQRERRIGGAKNNIPSHARRQINHHIRCRFANALDHFSIEVNGPVGRTCLRISNMAMNHCSTGFSCLNGRVSNLLGATRHFIAALLSATRSCDRSRNKDLLSHCQWHTFFPLTVFNGVMARFLDIGDAHSRLNPMATVSAHRARHSFNLKLLLAHD